MVKPILFNTEMVRAILDGRKTVMRLLSLPDVRPVVRGRWKRVDPRSTVVTFRCSECNYYAHMNATNFCPNCGADMREVNYVKL